MSPDQATAPLGENPRDRALAWRVASVLLSGAAVCMLGLLTFSAESYVRGHAAVVVAEAVAPLADLPPRVKRMEEITAERTAAHTVIDTHSRQVDIAIQRLTGIAENQQRQLDRQQLQLDRMEQLLRVRP